MRMYSPSNVLTPPWIALIHRPRHFRFSRFRTAGAQNCLKKAAHPRKKKKIKVMYLSCRSSYPTAYIIYICICCPLVQTFRFLVSTVCHPRAEYLCLRVSGQVLVFMCHRRFCFRARVYRVYKITRKENTPLLSMGWISEPIFSKNETKTGGWGGAHTTKMTRLRGRITSRFVYTLETRCSVFFSLPPCCREGGGGVTHMHLSRGSWPSLDRASPLDVLVAA